MNQEVKKIRRILIMFLFTAAISGLVACENFKVQQPAVDPTATWSLQTDIQPIFNANCITCHGATRAPDLREGKSYQALTNGGYVTLPAEQSTLYSKMSGPDHASRSTDADKLKVLYWITQGAQDN
jgi:mono/diheme cytochrome c family protein